MVLVHRIWNSALSALIEPGMMHGKHEKHEKLHISIKIKITPSVKRPVKIGQCGMGQDILYIQTDKANL